MDALTIGQQIKKKYPQYAQMDDVVLGQKYMKKYGTSPIPDAPQTTLPTTVAQSTGNQMTTIGQLPVTQPTPQVNYITGRSPEEHMRALQKARAVGNKVAEADILSNYEKEFQYQTTIVNPKQDAVTKEANKKAEGDKAIVGLLDTLEELKADSANVGMGNVVGGWAGVDSKQKQFENKKALAAQFLAKAIENGRLSDKDREFYRSIVGIGSVGFQSPKNEEIDSLIDTISGLTKVARTQPRSVNKGVPQEIYDSTMGVAHNVAQDINAGVTANMSENTRNQAKETGFATAKSLEERAMRETDPVKKKQLLSDANTIYQAISNNAAQTSQMFSKDINQDVASRSIGAAAQIAGGAEVVANPSILVSPLKALRHPVQTAKGAVSVIKNPVGAAKEFIKSDWQATKAGWNPFNQPTKQAVGATAKAAVSTVDDVAKQTGKPLDKQVTHSIRKIRLDPSVYGHGREQEVNAALDTLGFDGPAEAQYAQLEPEMQKLGDHITRAMDVNPKNIDIEPVLTDFQKNMQSKGVFRAMGLKRDAAQKEARDYMIELFNRADKSGNLILPKNIPDTEFFAMKQNINADYQGVAHKLKTGQSLSDRDKVIYAARQTWDDAFARAHPEIKKLTVLQSKLYDAAPSLYAMRDAPDSSVEVFGTKLSAPARFAQKGKQIIGDILGGEKQPFTPNIPPQTAEPAASLKVETPPRNPMPGGTATPLEGAADIAKPPVSLKRDMRTRQGNATFKNGEEIFKKKNPQVPSNSVQKVNPPDSFSSINSGIEKQLQNQASRFNDGLSFLKNNEVEISINNIDVGKGGIKAGYTGKPSMTKGNIDVNYYPHNGKIVLTDGNHRLYEAVNRGETTIKARVTIKNEKGLPIHNSFWEKNRVNPPDTKVLSPKVTPQLNEIKQPSQIAKVAKLDDNPVVLTVSKGTTNKQYRLKDFADNDGYIYHTTSPDNVDGITATGLKPADGYQGKAVYFAPDEATTTGQASYDGATVRVNVKNIDTKHIVSGDVNGFGDPTELVYGKSIPPDAIEVKTKTGWKPLVEKDIFGKPIETETPKQVAKTKILYQGGDESRWYAETPNHASIYGDVKKHKVTFKKLFDYQNAEEANKLADEFVNNKDLFNQFKSGIENEWKKSGMPILDIKENAITPESFKQEILNGSADFYIESPEFNSFLKSKGYDGATLNDMGNKAYMKLFDEVPMAGSGEQILETKAGWKPGMRKQFDTAVITKDREAVKRLLPEVPAEYKQRFATEIKNLTDAPKPQEVTKTLYRGSTKSIDESITKEGGLFLTEDKNYASKFAGKEGKISEIKVNIKKPYDITDQVANQPERELLIEAPQNFPNEIESLKKQGYDAITYKGQYYILDAKSVKPQSIPKVNSDLITEARKYKSAEEFVEKQGTPVYRGLSKNGYKKYKFDYYTADRSYAKEYAGEFGDIIEATADIKNPFIIEAKKGGYGEITVDGRIIGFYRELDDKAVSILKNKGYDGIVANFGDKKNFEVIPFSSNQIKTKSQLTDIWNQANKSGVKFKNGQSIFKK